MIFGNISPITGSATRKLGDLNGQQVHTYHGPSGLSARAVCIVLSIGGVWSLGGIYFLDLIVG
jgi:hypothetical protein